MELRLDEVPGLDQSDAQAAGGGVEGAARAHDTAPDDEDVELLGGHGPQRLRAGLRGERDGSHV